MKREVSRILAAPLPKVPTAFEPLNRHRRHRVDGVLAQLLDGERQYGHFATAALNLGYGFVETCPRPSRRNVQWNRYDASVAERAGRAESRLVRDAWASIGESE